MPRIRTTAILIAFVAFVFAAPSAKTIAHESTNFDHELPLPEDLDNNREHISTLAAEYMADTYTASLPPKQRIPLLLAAGLHEEAADAISRLTKESSKLNPWTPSFFTTHYQAFNDAKLREAKHGESFHVAYAHSLRALYNSVERQYSSYMIESFPDGAVRLKNQIDKRLAKHAGQQNISNKEIRALAMDYGNWLIAETRPRAEALLAVWESERIHVQGNITLEMPDGATLHATVARPADTSESDTKKRPAILIYSLYAHGRAVEHKIKEAALRGYVGLLVYGRGKGLSHAEITPFEHEAADAYHIIDWISRQPWSNGEVGMFGGSYLGFTQWAATKTMHPALKTIVPSAAVVPGINDNLTENNILSTGSLSWFHLVGNNKWMDFQNYYDHRWDALNNEWYKQGPAFEDLDALDGHPNMLFQRWLAHPKYDSYWQDMVPYGDEFAAIDIPVLATTSYFDQAQHGTFYYHGEHTRRKPDAEHYLLVGPLDHLDSSGMPRPAVDGYKIAPVGHINVSGLAFDWFDYIFKGAPRPALIKDKINYQPMGSNVWHHASSLKEARGGEVTLYLGEVGAARVGALSDTEPTGKEAIGTQTVDFSDRSGTYVARISPQLRRTKLRTNTGFLFETGAVEDPFELTGHFSVKLKLRTNKRDFDVALVLYELLADGTFMKLSHYKGRLSYAADREKRKLIRRNRETEITFNNSHFTSRRVAKGSRLVLRLMVNNNSRDQINYGSGKPVKSETIADAGTPLSIEWLPGTSITIPYKKLANGQ